MCPRIRPILLASVAALALSSCGLVQRGQKSTPTPERYTALADTTVCVVDRTTDQGLRDLQAKRSEDSEVVLWTGGRMQPLTKIHPVSLIAGYGGAEPWFARNEPISFRGQRFNKVETERRIPSNVLARVGEYQGILLFADPKDQPPPEAVYVPVRPGCIFQAYVREDLLR